MKIVWDQKTWKMMMITKIHQRVAPKMGTQKGETTDHTLWTIMVTMREWSGRERESPVTKSRSWWESLIGTQTGPKKPCWKFLGRLVWVRPRSTSGAGTKRGKSMVPRLQLKWCHHLDNFLMLIWPTIQTIIFHLKMRKVTMLLLTTTRWEIIEEEEPKRVASILLPSQILICSTSFLIS